MSGSETINRKIFLSGRVQGVFFRESTRQVASELGLVGGVRNLRDGRVEVQVSGDEHSVQSLINWLKIGPKSAKVSTIEVINLKALQHDPVVGSNAAEKRFVIWETR